MKDRYYIVEDPNGGVSVAVNHEVKVKNSISPNPSSGGVVGVEMGSQGSQAATVSGDSHILMVRRQNEVEISRQQEERPRAYRIGVEICAYMFLLSSVVNVCVHKRLIDILNVVFSSLTSLAIRYDCGILSKFQLAIHGSFAVGSIVPLALINYWGQVIHQIGCFVLCMCCLMKSRTQ